MISWICGKRIDNWIQGAKHGIVLACAGIGYEIQLTPKHQDQIKNAEDLALWTHQLQRDDLVILYGFETKQERNLFRSLIGVNGIGAQIAIALLENNTVNGLIKAIVERDIPKLTTAQGVGKRTAERIAIELNHKVSEFSNFIPNEQDPDKKIEEIDFPETILDDLKGTLKDLGYDEIEVSSTIKSLAETEAKQEIKSSAKGIASEEELYKKLLRESLVLLSQEK